MTTGVRREITSVKDLKKLLAIANYFQGSIVDFNGIIKPLNDLLKDGVEFRLGLIENRAIGILVKAIQSPCPEA